jgi:ATP/ADP translocase
VTPERRTAAANVLSLTGSIGAVAAFLIYLVTDFNWDGWLVISAVAIVVAVIGGAVSLALALAHGHKRRSAAATLGLALLLVALAISAVVLVIKYWAIE